MKWFCKLALEIINNEVMKMDIRNNRIFSNDFKKPLKPINDSRDNSFQSIFEKKVEQNIPVQFSKHANLRLGERSINLSSNQMKRVQSGVEEAKSKGIKESLVLVDNVALIVSIKNNTVITATSNNSNVFTNIDGAVIV